MQQALPLTHFRGEKAADSKASWTFFRLGNTITFGLYWFGAADRARTGTLEARTRF